MLIISMLKNIVQFKIIIFILLFAFVSCGKETKYVKVSETDGFASTKQIPDSHFLGDNNCKECHKEQYKDWKGSHHDKAVQLTDSTSVLGNFNDAAFTSQGVTSNFFKKDADFM